MPSRFSSWRKSLSIESKENGEARADNANHAQESRHPGRSPPERALSRFGVRFHRVLLPAVSAGHSSISVELEAQGEATQSHLIAKG